MANLLIIDDDEFTREVLRELLEAEHAITLAIDGGDGVEKAVALKPDLIICDVRMPVLDGFEVLTALRGQPATASIPFVFLSAATDPVLQRRGILLGAEQFLTKPVRRSQVLDVVRDRLRSAVTSANGVGSAAAGSTLDVGEGASPPRDAANLTHDDRASAAAASFADTFLVNPKPLLHVEICSFDRFATSLPLEEFGKILTYWYGIAKEQIGRHNGWVAQQGGDSLMAQFGRLSGRPGSDVHGAIDAGICLIVVARKFAAQLRNVYGAALQGDFSIRVLVHQGQVTLDQRPTAPGRKMTVAGKAIDEIDGMRAFAGRLGWTMAVSESVSRDLPPGYLIGRTQADTAASAAGGGGLVEIRGLSDGLPQPSTRSPQLLDGTRAIAENDLVCGPDLGDDPAQSMRDSNPHSQQMLVRGYRMLREITGGGMARIYLVRDLRSGELEVLKVLIAYNQNLKTSIRRFLQEFSLLSGVQHPQVVQIRDQWFADGLACIAMEYLPSGDLSQALDKNQGRGMDLAKVARTMKQIATGLAAIHDVGIVHCDLKPGNIMRRIDGTMVITDFGIATHLASTDGAVVPVNIVGTFHYMSPEQIRREPLTASSDLYSLGVIYYQLLTGRQPFVGDSPESILKQHLWAPIPQLPEAIAELQQILDRLLAKAPADRFPNALAVCAAIDLFAPGP